MSDIEETLSVYNECCRNLAVKPCVYVSRILRIKLDHPDLDKESTDRLHLAGSNYLATKDRLEDVDIRPLAKCLENNVFIHKLDLRHNRIGNDGAQSLAVMLKENNYLTYLNLASNNIGPLGVQHIAEALQENQYLKTLVLTGNKIDVTVRELCLDLHGEFNEQEKQKEKILEDKLEMEQKGGMALAQALQINTTLEHLDLSDCDLNIDCLIALATVLRYNKSITYFNVSRPLVRTHQEEPTVHIADMLKVNSSLKEIHMEKFEMSPFGAQRLADGLLHNFHLTHLNLSSNRITRDGVFALCEVLKKDTALEVLDVSNNRIEDGAAVALAQAIATFNTNLRILVIRYNNIGKEGLCALAEVLELNTSLQEIYVWGNNFSDPVCRSFKHLFDIGRLKLETSDVKPYVVDSVCYLAEIDWRPRRTYYTAAFYGDPKHIPDFNKVYSQYVKLFPDFEAVDNALQTVIDIEN